jgi:hypothetical protein
VWLFALAVALGLIALASPLPGQATDRGAYEATATRFIVPDCSDLHCFRVLVPWVLGVLPGSSLVKWKAYAVAANWLAAVGVYALSTAWGLSARAAAMATVMSAFGFGSLYTLFDPYTSDPLMYAIGPFLMWLLLHDRLASAGTVAAVGVLAKEFAAAPMLIMAIATAAAGRAAHALRVFAWANVALITWLALQLALIIAFNYSYAGNSSTHLLSGGYLAHWLSRQSWQLSVMALYGALGMLWLLAPAGLWLAAPSIRNVALASIPAVVIFAYVQQPDRALWNFHFILTPLAALVLARAPVGAAWACVAAFALANLRLGAQLPFVPSSRGSLMASAAIAIGCIYGLRSKGRVATA